jgi:DNA-binding NtrC family response regulator
MSTTIRDNQWAAPQGKPTDFPPKNTGPESVPGEAVKPRILVIDDDACFCELLSLYFVAKGFDVITARTAEQAERFVDQGRFDLVILDWYLGGEDALELLNSCKKRHPGVPVIIFTGAEVDMLLKAALAGRVDGVIRKMGSLESLSSQVCHYLGWPELRIVK